MATSTPNLRRQSQTLPFGHLGTSSPQRSLNRHGLPVARYPAAVTVPSPLLHTRCLSEPKATAAPTRRARPPDDAPRARTIDRPTRRSPPPPQSARESKLSVYPTTGIRIAVVNCIPPNPATATTIRNLRAVPAARRPESLRPTPSTTDTTGEAPVRLTVKALLKVLPHSMQLGRDCHRDSRCNSANFCRGRQSDQGWTPQPPYIQQLYGPSHRMQFVSNSSEHTCGAADRPNVRHAP